MTHTEPRRPRVVALIAATLMTAGCVRDGDSGRVEPPPHDPGVARRALLDALEAWKRGEVSRLAQGASPIRFADDDLATGLRLVDYSLDPPEQEVRSHEGVSVSLTLRDSRGATLRRKATYQVGTSPVLFVLRSEE